MAVGLLLALTNNGTAGGRKAEPPVAYKADGFAV
jgi:hypothetical protein